MLRSYLKAHKLLAAFVFTIASLIDSTALSITANSSTLDSELSDSLAPEVATRSTTEVQVRRLRALLISADKSSQNSIYERLERLQRSADSANRN